MRMRGGVEEEGKEQDKRKKKELGIRGKEG